MTKDDEIHTLLYLLLILGIYLCALLLVFTSPIEASTIEDINTFLANDTTDSQGWHPYYTCGHFSRDLAYNASLHNISIGGIILGNNQLLLGRCNHIANYVVINNSIAIIEPQTDTIVALNPGMSFEGMHYKYYRLYPDGTQVPSNWAYLLATKQV